MYPFNLAWSVMHNHKTQYIKYGLCNFCELVSRNRKFIFTFCVHWFLKYIIGLMQSSDLIVISKVRILQNIKYFKKACQCKKCWNKVWSCTNFCPYVPRKVHCLFGNILQKWCWQIVATFTFCEKYCIHTWWREGSATNWINHFWRRVH